MINQLLIIMPEILLAVLAMFLQLIAVFFRRESGAKIALFGCILALGIIFYLCSSYDDDIVIFNDSFAVFKSLGLFKAIILAMALMSILIYCDLNIIEERKVKIEFVTLVLLSSLGGFIAISARDCLLLFCGLELQALSGYALAAFNTSSVKSSEAGMKYFILGALMSCVMLLGISFLYGFSGSIKFIEIKSVMSNEINLGLIAGSILLLAPILFKLSAAPLHMWTPDIYEGAPISAVSYFAASQKVSSLIVLVMVLGDIMGDYHMISNDIIKIAAILSMFIGAFGAIVQKSLKRLMAYSTILNIGYALSGVCLYSPEGKYAAFLYILIYTVAAIGFFACLVALFGDKSDEASFEDIQGIAKKRKALSAAITILTFSMIGLPPFAGFFGKYYIFYNAISTGEMSLAIIGVLSSVVAAFYYLKIVKYIYFMPASKDMVVVRTKKGLWFVTIISLSFTLFFFTFADKYIG